MEREGSRARWRASAHAAGRKEVVAGRGSEPQESRTPENGRVVPSIETLEKVARALEVPLFRAALRRRRASRPARPYPAKGGIRPSLRQPGRRGIAELAGMSLGALRCRDLRFPLSELRGSIRRTERPRSHLYSLTPLWVKHVLFSEQNTSVV